MTAAFCSSFFQMGTITTCVGASFGGRINPLSSPWVMTSPPTSRVLTPQLVFHAYSQSPSSVWKFRSNCFAKFCPRL